MKKILLFFSIIIFSLLFINTNVSAQTYPRNPKQIKYLTHTFDRENSYTYEFYVIFTVSVPVFENVDDDDYFLVNNINVVFRRGLNRNTNSYVLEDKIVLTSGNTEFYFRITVLKTIVDTDYPSEEELTTLFNEDIAMYVDYLDLDNTEYTRGYSDGYEIGHADGYDEGYNLGYDVGDANGYDRGYNKGLSEGNTSWGVLFGAMMSTFGAVLAIEILPDLTIGMILAVPLVLGLLAFIIGVAKGGKNND